MKVYYGPNIEELCQEKSDPIDMKKLNAALVPDIGVSQFMDAVEKQIFQPRFTEFEDVLCGIRLGMFNGIRIEIKEDVDSSEWHRLIYILAKEIAMKAQRLKKNVFINPAFQSVVHELWYCYEFGVGIPRNQKTAKELEKWLICSDEETDDL